ncbi:toxin secretion/phage lysis holin [Enterococcus faecalis]|nr:toxin secretion/phage lysis holin [Enterococcus faecalis]
MEKYFNHLSIAASIVGGICISFLGGMDQLLDVLLFLMIVDFVTGWLKAIVTKITIKQNRYVGNRQKSNDFICSGSFCES